MKTTRFRSLRAQAASLAALLLLPLLATLSGGCLAVTVSGGKETSSSATPRTRYRDVEVASIDPVVKRTGRDTAEIRFEATGTFPYERTETVQRTKAASERMAVGILPGLAEDSPGDAIGNTLVAIWYNVCFLGAPTLHGILFEPFAPVSEPEALESMGTRTGFSRAALVGFYKYRTPTKSWADPRPKKTKGTLRRVPLDSATLAPEGGPFKVRSSRNGKLTLANVPAGRQECRVRLTLPRTDPLYDVLAPLLSRPISFTIPE